MAAECQGVSLHVHSVTKIAKPTKRRQCAKKKFVQPIVVPVCPNETLSCRWTQKYWQRSWHWPKGVKQICPQQIVSMNKNKCCHARVTAVSPFSVMPIKSGLQTVLKRTVSRDFLPPFFNINFVSTPKSVFSLTLIVKIFEVEYVSLVSVTLLSQKNVTG